MGTAIYRTKPKLTVVSTEDGAEIHSVIKRHRETNHIVSVLTVTGDIKSETELLFGRFVFSLDNHHAKKVVFGNIGDGLKAMLARIAMASPKPGLASVSNSARTGPVMAALPRTCRSS